MKLCHYKKQLGTPEIGLFMESTSKVKQRHTRRAVGTTNDLPNLAHLGCE